MFNDIPPKQSESHVDGSSTTDDTESNNTPTTAEANAKDSFQSARNKRFYWCLGGTVVASVVVVVLIAMTVVLLGDGIRGNGKNDTLASSSSSVSSDTGIVAVPNSSMVLQEDRATRITNFINSIKLSTNVVGMLQVPTQSLLEEGWTPPPSSCRYECFYPGNVLWTFPPQTTEGNDTTPAATRVSTGCGVPSTTATMEQQALAWLIHDDPLQLDLLPVSDTDTKETKFQLQQRYALLTLLLQFPFFLFDIANNTAPFHECDWISHVYGGYVSDCSLSDRVTVTAIDTYEACILPGATLSPDLGLLSNLVSFSVPLSTHLAGSLPETLTQWSQLQTFQVSEAALTGTIPAAFGTAWGQTLGAFSVSANRLTGSLPDSLRAWTNVSFFAVSMNQLTGTIPGALNDWSKQSPASLQTAYFDDNLFTGSIPSEFCHSNNGYNSSFIGGHLSADCDRVTCDCCEIC